MRKAAKKKPAQLQKSGSRHSILMPLFFTLGPFLCGQCQLLLHRKRGQQTNLEGMLAASRIITIRRHSIIIELFGKVFVKRKPMRPTFRAYDIVKLPSF